ncbi:jg2700 [Pararge aegeria aegeria]|uniref:Jg2700 protein n=1 Tax=Pararge aegeria aegeria TaxID=348720 RepID=A0A8S4QJ40_9NEOP|nr:jg2700 [Pararge aegeria aegeria]
MFLAGKRCGFKWEVPGSSPANMGILEFRLVLLASAVASYQQRRAAERFSVPKRCRVESDIDPPDHTRKYSEITNSHFALAGNRTRDLLLRFTERTTVAPERSSNMFKTSPSPSSNTALC